MKKFASLALALLMLVVMVPVVSMAAGLSGETKYPADFADFTEGNVVVDENGKQYASLTAALKDADRGTTLYCKENAAIALQTHTDVTKDLTIYGNGADFSGGDLSIGTYAAPVNANTTINIYNAKNIVVWGQPVGDRADTWNINLYNCENDGYNFLMYRDGSTGTATLNLVMQDCKANGFSDSIVHTTADGSINIVSCEFSNNCAPINIAHKQSGTMTVTVENCTFDGCGKVDPSNDYFAPARFVNNNEEGALNVTLNNNTFTNTVGTNGDILLGDYREGKESYDVTATITPTGDTTVKNSLGDPKSVTEKVVAKTDGSITTEGGDVTVRVPSTEETTGGQANPSTGAANSFGVTAALVAAVALTLTASALIRKK